ncbi:MAG: bifunctional diguanylate cyclase/phosphodiesterase [Candidatus Thiodiazotropha sp. (ex Ustalcina ferruginea)]|nr:bifunctional diguanylate cyclase/phosphodiesterase [Candidatus Thiodiazotropha sp. (ex Ustalcina ferruginea)]
MMEQSDRIYIVVTKAPTDNNEYYTQYADPPLFPDSIENTYDNPYPQDAIENNKKAIAMQSGMDFESFMRSEEIIQYDFFDPWLDQESIDIIIYNNEFELFTSLSHEYTLITDKYYKASLKYVLLFLLFNLILFFLIRYIDRIQSTSKQVLQFQATHDQLTSLPNRYYLERHFANWHPHNNDRYSVIFLDMNNFKNINDNYGHTIGDKILVQLAQRLQSACADEALVVRQGGDEFIFIKPYTNNHELRAFIIFLIKSIKEKIYVDSLEFYLNGCIGVSISGRHDSALEELLRQADLAMYEAKRSHTDFTFYSEQLQQISNERSDIDEALHYAFTDNQMYMEYQPQISSESGRIVGVEALIRWAHPTMGMVSPEKFIPIAESSGLINTVGDFVIDSRFREILEIHNLDIQQPIRISINISVR